MSKKILLIVLLVIILACLGGYFWLDYSQAQTALVSARQRVTSVDTWLHKNQNVDTAAENYGLAQSQVDGLGKFHSPWISRADIDLLEKELSVYKEEIDQRKKKP